MMLTSKIRKGLATASSLSGSVARTVLAVGVLWLTISPLICIAASSNLATVTDFRGASLDAEKPAQRIVCLIESALSSLFMLGVQRQVVGVSTNIYDPEVYSCYAPLDPRIAQKQLPTPGNWDFVNIESVVALAPDLVIIWAHQTEAIAAMEERHLRVYGVMIHRFEDIHKEIRDLGMLTGSGQRAGELIDYTRKELARIENLVANMDSKEKPGVYFMWAQGPLETSGSPSTVNNLIDMAGGRNVCAHIHQEHLVINLELLLQYNPDVVVMWNNPKESPSSLMTRPVWRSVQAVRYHRVHEMPPVFFCDLWTLKYPFAVKLMSLWCYPQLGSHWKIEQEAAIMLNTLYGDKAAERISVENLFP